MWALGKKNMVYQDGGQELLIYVWSIEASMKFLYHPLSSEKCGPPPFVHFRVFRICFGLISTKHPLVGQYGIHVHGPLFSITHVISLGIH